MRIKTVLVVLLAVVGTPAVAANLSVPGDHATIQEAVNAASPGDVINVGPGNYAGAYIFKSVTIIGSPGTIIDEANLFSGGEDAFDIVDGADGTTIRDMTFVGVLWGVFGLWANDVTVTNCVFLETHHAVDSRYGYGWRMEDLDVRNSTRGVYGFQADDVTVTNSLFLNTHNAIWNDSGNGWTITDNFIDGFTPWPPFPGPTTENHQWGILVNAPARDNFIGNNWVRHEGNRNPGYLFDFYEGIAVGSSTDNVVENNTVVGNEVEVVVPDADSSNGVALIALGDPAAVRNNTVVDNDVRRSITPIGLYPRKLRKSNVVKPNLVH